MSKHKSLESPVTESLPNAAVDVWELSMALREAAMANPVKSLPPGLLSDSSDASERPDATSGAASDPKQRTGSHPT